MKRFLICLTLASAALSACNGSETSCVSSAECFKGEVCIDEVCEADPGATPNSGSTNSSNDNPGNNTTATNGNPHTTNNTTSSMNNTSSGLCMVDPFTAMCPTDDNDTFAEYIRTETGRGCLGGGDDFEGGSYTLMDQTLCALEGADKFSTNLIPCDNITFVVEVTVTPHQMCNPSDWDFNMRLQGNDCVETNDKMRCEDLPDGSKRATGFLEPSISVTSPYIDITPVAENIQFDYDVTIVVRE